MRPQAKRSVEEEKEGGKRCVLKLKDQWKERKREVNDASSSKKISKRRESERLTMRPQAKRSVEEKERK